MRRILAALAFAAILAAPSAALGQSKPSPACGTQFSDRAGEVDSANLDLIGGFFAHDPGLAEQATTINIQVDELDTTVPAGSTFVVWALEYVNPPEETIRFVRAVADFSGLVFYEYGEQSPVANVTVNRPLGSTEGAFFEGKEGIVQIVVPADRGGAGGTTFRGYSLVTQTGAPGIAAAQTPTRGPLTEVDAVAGRGSWTAAPCAGAPLSAEPQPGPDPAPDRPPAAEDRVLPVDVVTRRVRRSRRPRLTLRSSEPIRDLAARLVKGRRTLARGALSAVDGKARLRLKARRKLRKGKYRLDLAGTTADGVRRFRSARLKVR